MAAEILVTGAPGNVGTEVMNGLQKLGIPFRVGVFDLNAASLEAKGNMEVVHFDFLKPETYATAFEGIKRLFLVRPPALSNVERDIAPAVRKAISSGVEHIVFLSLQGVEKNRIVPHYKIEQLILESGIRYTFLRASFFMQNLSTTQAREIREQDEIALPVGRGKISFIDVRDIAATAVCALTGNQHIDKKYTITGSEALNYYEVADKLSQVLQRPIQYRSPSVLNFIVRQLRSGRKLDYTLVITALHTITRFGNASETTHDLETILGRPSISFDQFAHDHQLCWQPL